MRRRFIAVLLVLVTTFSTLPISVFAITSEEYEKLQANALDKAFIYQDGDEIMEYLVYDGTIQQQTMFLYDNVSADGKVEQWPAYCIMPDKWGANLYPYQVSTTEYVTNPKVYGIVTNGYPYKTLGELGVVTKQQGFYATKMALWTYIWGWDLDKWTAVPGYESVLTALKKIYNAGMVVNEIPVPVLNVTPDKLKAERDSLDSSYVSMTYTVSSNVDIKSFSVYLDGNVPTGAFTADLQNKPKSEFVDGEDFKVLIPADSISGQTGDFKVVAIGLLRTEAVIYGASYDPNLQSYALMRDPFEYEKTELNITYSSKNTFLRIVKVEAGTNIPLAGAVFRVSDSNGNVIGTFTSDGSGSVVVPLTESGRYYVDEIVPPDGYVLSNDAHQQILVTWEGTATVTFANEKKPRLAIQKIDADTGLRLPGATIRIAHQGGMSYTEVTTDYMGMAYVDLKPGIYTLTETAAPKGYIVDPTPQTVLLEAGKTTSITLKNKEKPDLKIKKYDEYTGIVLEGAEFSIAKKGGSIIYEEITDETGLIELEGLEPGWYTITELAAPAGYLMATKSKDVYLEEGKAVEVKFDNRLKPSLNIQKLDSQTGQPLAGAIFEVRKAGDISGTEYVTDIDGHIMIHDLEEAVYIIKEVGSPTGYLNEHEQKEVGLKWGTMQTLVFTNKAEPALKILKVDEETNEPLAGARFRVSEAGGGIIGEYSTDANGEILLEGLRDMTYSIEETSAPEGYILDPQHKDVKLGWGRTTSIVFSNKTKPALEILKVDEETKAPLAGAKFRVSATDGSTVGEYITDSDGRIIIRGLEEKTYSIEEISAPKGYLLEAQHKDIMLEWGTTKSVVFTNKAEPALEIIKLDEKTREPLAGATFRVTAKDGNTVGEYVTDASGCILITGLKAEAYSIEETSAPDGYILEAQHKDIMLEWGKTKSIIFTNKEKASLEIMKHDMVTGEPLAGAKFKVTAKDGSTVGEYMTDANGRILITGLEAEAYSIGETSAPGGYILGAQRKDIMLEWGTTKTLMFENVRKPTLVITKTDALTYAPIQNTTFKIKYEDTNGNIREIGSYRTDANGQIILTQADPGWYTITETSATPGYSLPSNPVTRKYLYPGENAYVAASTATDPDIGMLAVTSGSDYGTGTEITDYPLNSIVIRKTSATTGELLAGAKFQVRRVTGEISGSSGTVIGEYTTDSSGVIVITGLDPGGYIVEEVKAPANYLINENSQQQVWLKYDGTSIVEASFDNIPYGSILITKADAQTGKPLANARFRVTDGSGAVVGNTNGEFITDENGEIMIPNVKPGSYVITETEAPEYYTVDTTPQTVTVGTDGKIYKVSFKNQPSGTLTILKLDSATREPLAGAEFKVTAADGSVVGTGNGKYTTDATGQIVIPNLPKGSYIVQETKAPDGYILENQQQAIAVDYGKTYTIEFFNKKMSGLQIIKIDSVTKQPLKGAEFTIYKQSGETMGSYTTDADGVIIIDTLAPGWYKAVETKTLEGYVLDETPKDVQITDNQFVKVVFENAPMSDLVIRKVDADTREPLEGAEFTVKTAGGLLVGAYRSGTDGTAYVTALAPGWYTVTETKAPEGYSLGDNIQTVQITNSRTVTLEFQNRPFGSLIIKKTDEITGRPLSGATFEVHKQGSGSIGEYTTGVDGTVSILSIEPGWYVISETKAPAGYTLDSTAKTIEAKSGIPATVNFTNKPLSGIEVIKLDAVSNKPLPGATFTIERDSGERIGTYKTDASGKFIVSDLAEGTYIVSEAAAPDGYALSDTPKMVAVKSGKLATVEFTNKPLAGLKIIKLDSVTRNPIEGVEFAITKMNGEKVGDDFRGYIFKTDKTGQVYIPNLADGYYTVIETRPASGYILDGEPKTVLIQSGKPTAPTVLEVLNTPMSSLLIVKTDGNTGKPLAGAVFDIKHADGSLVTGNILDGNQPGTANNSPNKGTTPNGDITGSYTTDANGRIQINGLEAGQYTVTERKAPDGYELDTKVYNVTITPGKTATLQLANKPLGGIRLTKIDSVTKKPIYNVEFMLFDANGKLVGVYYTDNNGTIDFPANIPEGRYTIRETRAAAGYCLDEIPKTVEFIAGKVTEITWTNTPEMGQIQITKKSADANEINGFPAGTPLEGAVFEAYDYKTGDLVDRFTSGKDGRAVSSPLPLGRYTVKEVQAPEYYKLSGKKMDITLEFATQIVKREFPNSSVSTGVHIKKTGNVEAMPGDLIRYDIKSARNTGTVPLTDFYWRDVLPTSAVRLTKIVTGTYNQPLKYKILATTNKGDTIIIADNLSTTRNNVIDCSNASLGLKSNEYVTSFTLVFGTVKAGFAQVEQPQIFVKVQPNLPNGYQFANKCDVGGKYGGEWVTGNSTCTTKIYSNRGKLPKTGY